MLFRTATAALVACAAHAAAEPAAQPYKLAMMPALARRDTLGYQPEEKVCGAGNTCDEACGAGFQQCGSNDDAIHCFNPEAAQSCCGDDNGNSCEAGFYCTSDSKSETWCCPDAMDLEECAAKFGVTGGLERPEPTSTEPESTSTPEPTTTPQPTTSVITTTTPSETPSTSPCTTSWTHANSTASVPTTSKVTTLPPPSETTGTTPPPEEGDGDEGDDDSEGAASASGVSLALLVAAAGFVALF